MRPETLAMVNAIGLKIVAYSDQGTALPLNLKSGEFDATMAFQVKHVSIYTHAGRRIGSIVVKPVWLSAGDTMSLDELDSMVWQLIETGALLA